jgi:flagellar biosynthesis protein FliP
MRILFSISILLALFLFSGCETMYMTPTDPRHSELIKKLEIAREKQGEFRTFFFDTKEVNSLEAELKNVDEEISKKKKIMKDDTNKFLLFIAGAVGVLILCAKHKASVKYVAKEVAKETVGEVAGKVLGDDD